MSNSFDFGTGNISLAFDVPFPSNADPGPGIGIDKTGSLWTVSLDYEPLAENSNPTPSVNYVAVYDPTLGIYQKARLDNVIAAATGLDTRTSIGDADYLALGTDRYIAVASPLTLNRTVTLPPANAVPGGREILIQDEIGTLNAQHYLIVKGTGTDMIDGRAQRILSTSYGGLRLRSNGTNAWAVIALSGVTPVADSNYTCNMDDHVVAFTALTAARTVTLPLAQNYPPGQRLTVMDQAGAATVSHTITLLPQGSDTINGIATSPALNAAYAFLGLVSDGLSRWTVVDNVGGGGGSGSITSSQITDASPLGRLLLTQTTAALDRTSLGSGNTGDAMFTAGTPAAGRAVLGVGVFGETLFQEPTAAQARTDLGLGSMALQNSNAVNITGGTITGVPGLGGGASITISDTPPGSPTAGSMWFDSLGGNTYIWYNDGTSSQWVSLNNPGNAYLPSSGGTVSGNLTVSGVLTAGGAGSHIDNTIIGQTTPAAGTFTDLSCTRWHGPGIRGYIAGLTLGWTDNTHFAVAAGEATADDFSWVMQAPAFTKSTAAWSAGSGGGALDTGALAQAWYHVFLIQRPDTGATDILMSQSVTAPTMPANYTKKRRIGSLLTGASPFNLVQFNAFGEEILLTANIANQSGAGLPNSATQQIVSVPPGVNVEWHGWAQVTNAANQTHGFYSPLGTAMLNCANVGGTYCSVEFRIITDTAQHIMNYSGGTGSTYSLWTLGWKDFRGRFA